MRIELHCHSTHSDGSETAQNVALRAQQRGVELFCLTDHDTCEGYEATRGICPRVLRGLELSCHENGRTVHILLYDVTGDETRWRVLTRRLAVVHGERHNRLRAIAARLNHLGICIDVEAIIATSGTRMVGRPDMANALVASGQVASIDEAFRRYLADGAAADVPMAKMSVAEGLALGRAAGARMALAHPHTLGEQAAVLLSRYRGAGLEALECFYGSYNRRQRRRWLRLANTLGLVVTGGSDFHGRLMPQIREPGIELPEPYAGRMCAWLGI